MTSKKNQNNPSAEDAMNQIDLVALGQEVADESMATQAKLSHLRFLAEHPFHTHIDDPRAMAHFHLHHGNNEDGSKPAEKWQRDLNSMKAEMWAAEGWQSHGAAMVVKAGFNLHDIMNDHNAIRGVEALTGMPIHEVEEAHLHAAYNTYFIPNMADKARFV